MNAKANNTIDKVRELQRKLYLGAKINKKRKYHILYDKIYREDILKKAWKQVKENKGKGGIDEIEIKDVKEYGEEKFLKEIQEEIRENRYTPKPVKREYIPKKDGNKRPLGIPVIKDRVVQMAAKIMIEPIFEADFEETSYGFRPKRNQHQALEEIRKKCNNKGWWVLDADIKGYFDNINHEKLIILIEQRINDRRVVKLITKWLKAGIMKDGKYEESEIGAPQGSPISPLLSNIYLNYVDTIWNKYYKNLGTLVRYADDFIIISKTKKEINHAYKAVKKILEILELELHPEKTRFVNMWDGKDGFDFLGFHHKRSKIRSRKGKEYSTTIQIPKKKAMEAMREKIREVLGNRSRIKMSMYDLVQIINKKVIGLRNYYKLKYANRQLHKIDCYIIERFTIWYNNKIQRKRRHRGINEIINKLNKIGLARLCT